MCMGRSACIMCMYGDLGRSACIYVDVGRSACIFVCMLGCMRPGQVSTLRAGGGSHTIENVQGRIFNPRRHDKGLLVIGEG
jgi:hypothetical protein